MTRQQFSPKPYSPLWKRLTITAMFICFLGGTGIAQPLSQQVLMLLDRVNVWTALQTFDDITVTGVCTGCGGAGGGTVTSVAMTVAPVGIFDIGGTPIVGAGTLALTMDTQADNIVFAGPNGGGPLVPSFRALVDADIPNILTLTGSSVLWSALDFTVSSLADVTTVSAADVTSGKLALARITTGGTVGQPLLAGAVDPAFAALDLSVATSITGQLVAASFPVLTGDITTPGGSLVTDLSATGVAAAIYGSATQIPQITFDDEGRATLAANISIGSNNLLDNSRHTDTAANAATRGSVITGGATNLWDELILGASGTVLRSDGTDALWSTVGTALTALDAANVTVNQLALANGGSNANITASHGAVVYSTATAWAHTAVGVAAQCLLSNGAAAPTWGACATLASHALLSATHSDTAASAVARGSLIIGNVTPAWSQLVVGVSGSVLTSDGTDLSWTTDGSGITSLNAAALDAGTVPLARLAGITDTEIAVGAAIQTSKLSDGTLDWSGGGVSTTAGGEYAFVGRATMSSGADGIIRFENDAGSDFTRLMLGPATTEFNAIYTTAAVTGEAQGIIIGPADGTAQTFANLGAATDGALIWCSDCTKATPCAGASTGAYAKRMNSTWDCD